MQKIRYNTKHTKQNKQIDNIIIIIEISNYVVLCRQTALLSLPFRISSWVKCFTELYITSLLGRNVPLRMVANLHGRLLMPSSYKIALSKKYTDVFVVIKALCGRWPCGQVRKSTLFHSSHFIGKLGSW